MKKPMVFLVFFNFCKCEFEISNFFQPIFFVFRYATADRAADAHDIERPDSTPPDFAVPTISGDVDDGYLADGLLFMKEKKINILKNRFHFSIETQDMIWERYAPYGNTILRRVRPVFAREARAVLVPQNSCCDLKCKLKLFVVFILYIRYIFYMY